MFDVHSARLLVAAADDNGAPQFVEEVPKVIGDTEAAQWVWLWATDTAPALPDNVGAVAGSRDFPGPSGTRFGVVCFPPHSAGKMTAPPRNSESAAGIHRSAGDPAMHRSDSVDYEFIVSGKIDLELPGGQTRTLGPGDALVLAGVPHAWHNRYDEACVYVAVIVGASSARRDQPEPASQGAEDTSI